MSRSAQWAAKNGYGALARLLAGTAPAAAPAWAVESRRPTLAIVFYNRDWCDGRLSREIGSRLTNWDVRYVANREPVPESDVYLFRNIGRLKSLRPDRRMRDRSICMLESDRPLQAGMAADYKLCRLVIAQNEGLRDRAVAAGVSNISAEILANGINCDEFGPGPEPEEFTVGACGNFSIPAFDEWKGFSQYIVPACELAGVKLKWCGWKGRVAGSDVAGEQVPLEGMADWYRSISCLVSMSVSEGCSGVTFEAMASGRPVISTSVGWHAEMDAPGIVWESRNVTALAARICELRDNPDWRRSLGLQGRIFAEQWPHQRIADRWNQILLPLA